jgi:hypothetical protein
MRRRDRITWTFAVGRIANPSRVRQHWQLRQQAMEQTQGQQPSEHEKDSGLRADTSCEEREENEQLGAQRPSSKPPGAETPSDAAPDAETAGPIETLPGPPEDAQHQPPPLPEPSAEVSAEVSAETPDETPANSQPSPAVPPEDLSPAVQDAESDAGPAPLESSPASAEDREAALAAADQRRAECLEILFGSDRPRPATAQQAAADYAQSLSEAAERVAVADETSRLAEQATRRHRAALESERERFGLATAEIERAIDAHEAFFQQLVKLAEELSGEVARLDEADPRLEGVPDALRARLTNYKKGVEIIHRMFRRVCDRKKQLAPTPPTGLTERLDLPEAPAEIEQIAAFAEQLSRRYHDLRDANYHAGGDANKHADECRGATMAAAHQLCSAVDGIDSGLANRSETRAALAEFQADGPLTELLDDWLAAYGRVEQHVDRFFSAVGIQSHTVEPGTRFDPETMEPQAVVPNPELNDEDVAVVVRRGFSLQGQQIRPMFVDVVRNG